MKTTFTDSLDRELRSRWAAIIETDHDRRRALRRERGIDFDAAGTKVWESDDFVYLPLTTERHHQGEVLRERVGFALGDEVLATVTPSVPYPSFDKGVARIRRTPELAQTTHGIAYALLWSLNEAHERVVEVASAALEAMSDEIDLATQGQDAEGKQLGVGDLRETMSRMNDAEETLSRLQESQLKLARAARHVRAETGDLDIAERLDVLIADIDGVKQHAGFEHDKVRFLQQSIMTTLDVKQNEIVKVFTIITAVFLPPTLIATFYGMNFTNMPELLTQHGFLITTLLTLIAAVIPLWYIKRMGWLR
jgi:magnesium transporter